MQAGVIYDTRDLEPDPGSGVFAELTNETSLKAFGWFTCGLTSAGVAFCWGANDTGQLGDGTQTNRSAPVGVKGGLTFAALTSAADGEHTCGVTASGGATRE